jgi:ATP-dependent DNA helicase RecG
MTSNVQQIKGVGPRLAEKLAKLGIHCVQDLLFHLPLRYEDRTRIMPLGGLRPGMPVAVEGKVELTEMTRFGRPQLLCRISDGTGFLNLRFFHFSKAQKLALVRGIRVRCFGEVRYGRKSGYEMIHPEYRRINPDEPVAVENYLTPIYPTTAGLHQIGLRKIISHVIPAKAGIQNVDTSFHGNNITQELLPQEILQKYNFPNLAAALLYLHRPPPDADIALLLAGKHLYQQRLIFEELLAHHLSLRKLRAQAKQHQAIALTSNGKLSQKFTAQLPFKLTKAQERVNIEVQEDLTKPHPMMRLIQGDVGSGKTVIAAMAALAAVENNCQAAIMAPTELLAEQHLTTFTTWFKPLGVELAWLSGQTKGKIRQASLAKIANGQAQIIIGTHALFQEEVEFKELALVVVDEQHRFGVHQRLSLREKGEKAGKYPHQLIMTATPIPRTLAMSAYADLDHSIIDELPPGRIPVTTVAIADSRRQEIIERIRQVCRHKHQAYWVCTLIEESEVLQCQAAENTAEQLKKTLSELKIGLIHGRIKPKEKEAIMTAFKNGKIDLLVATTVIEVGVDIPNASLMIIENPERLGLAQLHQLRGRIGRGAKESHCVLLYKSPLTYTAKKRVDIMRKTNDGFIIAQKDLELRGPGEVLGTRQAGIVNMKIASLLRDQYMLPKIQQTANYLLKKHPNRLSLLIKRWVAQAERYGRV